MSILNVLLTKTGGGIAGSIGNGESAAMQLSADSVVAPCGNVLVSHVSTAGGRANICYQDTGVSRVAKDIILRYSALVQKNTKADLFPTENGARTGSFAYRWGTDNIGVVSGDTSANPSPIYNHSSWLGEVLWLGCQDDIGYSNMYVNDLSLTGNDSSYTGGNYTPKSALLNRVPSGLAVAPFDLVGTAIPNNGTGAAGALQLSASSGGGRNLLLLGVG
jgi:hypothetical protein